MNYYLYCWQNFANFSGRARRKEFWMFTLFNILISIAIGVVESALGVTSGYGLVSGLYALAVFIPSLAVLVRRLHDTDRSGWWALLLLIPLIGSLVLLVFACIEGTRGDNRFGADPKSA
jgi:uncharacterized membrane protein YhaH (DUF805 family)